MRAVLLVAAALATASNAGAAHHHVAPKHHKAKPAAAPTDGSAAGSGSDAPKKKRPRGWPSPAAGPTMSGDPELIFTFDDGPNLKTTPGVLDALAAHHIHATFFMVGEMAANPRAKPVIERILAEGHIIANHTMTHQDLCRLKDDGRANREIDDGKAAIEGASGFTTVWFRTPYGVRCQRVEDMLAARHLDHFHWDLDPQEWKHNNPQKAYDYVTKQLAKMTGRDVLLMHDIKTATVEALPKILDFLDQENARRAAAHERRIRVIQSYDLARERLPAGELDWLHDAFDLWPAVQAFEGVLP